MTAPITTIRASDRLKQLYIEHCPGCIARLRQERAVAAEKANLIWRNPFAAAVTPPMGRAGA